MKDLFVLGIESSCDDTSAAVLNNSVVLSNVVATQLVHEEYGGVVPELASRAHQQNIIPVVDKALKEAGVDKNQIHAIAFTRGPGLMGALMVGTSFAKGFALAKNIPLIDVNHLQAHVLAHFIKTNEEDNHQPKFPFLCLLVSGGNSQIVIVRDYLNMEVIGQTIDDAAGEAFDKCAKVLGLPYPGGPMVDKLAAKGDLSKYKFNKPRITGYDYSFSGLKTSFLYFLRDKTKENPLFIENEINHLCASLQNTIVEILLEKLEKAAIDNGITTIALAGGVSANSALRLGIAKLAEKYNWETFIPNLSYTTDNAAMIAITGYYKFLNGEFCGQEVAPFSRLTWD